VPLRAIVPNASKPPSQVTITPAKAGTTTITIVADNGAHVGATAFSLITAATPAAEKPPQPASGLGLSKRRNSFLPSFKDLP
jgi:hypothetical protein